MAGYAQALWYAHPSTHTSLFPAGLPRVEVGDANAPRTNGNGSEVTQDGSSPKLTLVELLIIIQVDGVTVVDCVDGGTPALAFGTGYRPVAPG